jgi:acetyl esterase/lipase
MANKTIQNRKKSLENEKKESNKNVQSAPGSTILASLSKCSGTKNSKVANPQVHSVPDSPESQLIGKNLQDAPDLVKAANPETYISKDDPPFFIQHGLNDPLVPYPQSVNFAEKLKQTLGKEKVSIELIPETGHGGPAFQTEQNLNKVFAFLDKSLK